jgi:hypothetical protein
MPLVNLAFTWGGEFAVACASVPCTDFHNLWKSAIAQLSLSLPSA